MAGFLVCAQRRFGNALHRECHRNGGSPAMIDPARIFFCLNHPKFISNAYAIGFFAQCELVVCGFMSSILTIFPAASMNATDNGNGVFFIHMHTPAGAPNKNTMPSLLPSFSRYIRPYSRCASVAATSALITYIPAERDVIGNAGC